MNLDTLCNEDFITKKSGQSNVRYALEIVKG